MSSNMKPYVKFGALTVVILGVLGWLAVGGISDTKTYYKEIAELQKMGKDGVDKRLRVGGDVTADPVRREGNNVYFTLAQNDLKLPVVYSGIDPLPDTFRAGAQALADGKLGADGVFHATKIQAKCASKYEAKPSVPNAASRM
jgi:cytochrome c-type biogenesis protein CcmE